MSFGGLKFFVLVHQGPPVVSVWSLSFSFSELEFLNGSSVLPFDPSRRDPS